jgi:hypothetical protein
MLFDMLLDSLSIYVSPCEFRLRICRRHYHATGTVKDVATARSGNGSSRRSCAKDTAYGPDQNDFRWLHMFNAAQCSPTHSRSSAASISTQSALLPAHGQPELQQSKLLSSEQFSTTLELLDSFASSRGYPVDEVSAQKLLTARADAPSWQIARAVYLYWHHKRSCMANDRSPACTESGSVFRDSTSLSAGASHIAPMRWHPQISSADLCSGLHKHGLEEFDTLSDVQALAAGLQQHGVPLRHPSFLFILG